MSTVLADQVQPFAKVRSTNSTSANYPSKVATTTEPATSTAGVLVAAPSTIAPKKILLVPYGTDADGETFKVRVIGWREVSGLWIPVPLAEATCTLSSAVGVDAASIENEEFFADTIELATGYPADSSRVYSPTGNVLAHLIVDVEGFKYVEVIFDRNASAASANALYAWL
jgi:hypothetical protein